MLVPGWFRMHHQRHQMEISSESGGAASYLKGVDNSEVDLQVREDMVDGVEGEVHGRRMLSRQEPCGDAGRACTLTANWVSRPSLVSTRDFSTIACVLMWMVTIGINRQPALTAFLSVEAT